MSISCSFCGELSDMKPLVITNASGAAVCNDCLLICIEQMNSFIWRETSEAVNNQPIIENYQIDNWERIRHSPVIDPAYRGSLDEINKQGVADITAFLELL